MTFERKLSAVLLSAVIAVAAPAFADTDVSHNWNSDNEAAAMRVFRDKYVALGGVWKDTSFPQTEESISSTKTRFIGGNPPMAVASSLGGVWMLEFAEAGLLQNMNAVAERENWATNLSPGIADSGKFDGVWVAAPVFVSVVNWIYSNNDVLAAAGVTSPTTWAEFKAALPRLRDAGYIPLAVGGSSWQEAILFDQVLLGVGGIDFYDGVMSGDPEILASDMLLNAFKEMAHLRDFTDEGKAGRSWNDSNALVLSDKAAFFFMGPWAAASYADMGTEGKKWSCRLTPWGGGLAIVAEGFQFMAVEDEASKAAQELFATAVMDTQTQIAAARAFGTLPATNMAVADDFEGCSAKAVSALSGGATAVTHWNGRPSEVGSAIKDTVSAFWNQAIDAQTAQHRLVEALAK